MTARFLPRLTCLRVSLLPGLLALSLVLGACQPAAPALPLATAAQVDAQAAPQGTPAPAGTALPERANYQPGELVAYTAQTGDTLPALAARFNTRVEEILAANSFIPAGATSLPPGMPMQIPIYFLPFWGTPYQILPDSLFINGPAQVGFDSAGFIARSPGWLSSYREYAAGANRSAAEIIEVAAVNFSVSPRLLLALLEYQAGALSQAAPPGDPRYPLGYADRFHRGLYLQLTWAANTLNNGYYGWRRGSLTVFEHRSQRLERPDPWQNAATVGLQYYFLQLEESLDYNLAISAQGLAAAYQSLFGDPWQADQPHIPGSLAQPDLLLPFEGGKTWAYTGGPHTGWGSGEPLAAIDFAPPAVAGGCTPSQEWVTAVAAGVVTRSEPGIVELDLDGDGDPRTGWTIFYLHIGSERRAPLGATLQAGAPLGYPSCEGGRTTGTHVHIARKYNGEWILADSPLAFNLEGWVAVNGPAPYQGYLKRFSQVATACECSNQASLVDSRPR